MRVKAHGRVMVISDDDPQKWEEIRKFLKEAEAMNETPEGQQVGLPRPKAAAAKPKTASSRPKAAAAAKPPQAADRE